MMLTDLIDGKHGRFNIDELTIVQADLCFTASTLFASFHRKGPKQVAVQVSLPSSTVPDGLAGLQEGPVTVYAVCGFHREERELGEATYGKAMVSSGSARQCIFGLEFSTDSLTE